MSLTFVPAQRDHIDVLGAICHAAFLGISEAHGFPPDITSVDLACDIMTMLIRTDGYYGVVALEDGVPVGSNFISLVDPVGGVGPLTVSAGAQGRGIGRSLMRQILDYAAERGIARVRLMQDSFNMTSLSLYASLGLQVREPIGLMRIPASAAASAAAPGVRRMEPADLAAADALCVAHYKVSRANETTVALRAETPGFVRERDGRITGYLLPGFLGHGVAETLDDAMALIAEVARVVPPMHAIFFCPLRSSELFRAALAMGCRVGKVMNLMSLGPYEEPDGIWMPSIGY